MRVSIRKDDPGYHPRAFYCQPYLNGEKLDNCITADEEKGEVFVIETLKEDGLRREVIERKTGTVRIETPEDWEA